MADLPGGTVTLMFTDIEGSTSILQRLAEAYPDVLFAHRDLVREAITVQGGTLLETQGDANYAVFPRALAGVRAATGAQRAIAAYPWPDKENVRVRIGLHTGEPVRTGGSYIGLDVHRAARICAAAHGGQTLLSAETAELVRRRLPEGVTLWDMGVHSLRGIAHAEHLFQVVVPGLPAIFPPLKTPDRPPATLPVPDTRLVGRDSELAALRNLLLDPANRLVTLTGPGGAGKTRLAVEAAARAVEQFPHGAVFVPLAPLTGPRELIPALGRALGVRETDARPQRERLAGLLRDQRRLILLDACDGQAAAFPDLVTLLDAAPRLTLLVTCRVPLGLDGERVLKVPGLGVGFAFPAPLPAERGERLTAWSGGARRRDKDNSAVVAASGAGEQAEGTIAEGKQPGDEAEPPVLNERPGETDGPPPAIALFLERAMAARPDFEMTAEHLREVTRICELIDGRPLAIELTAARIKTLPPRAVLSRLERRLAFLTSGARDPRAFRPALRGAIAWSYHLLTPAEQALFRRLAVFSGGWTVPAASAVCDAGDLDGGVQAGLASLLDKRLIIREREPERPGPWAEGAWWRGGRDVNGDGPRFEMPDTIRDYALERLVASREEPEARGRHAAWYLALAEAAEPGLAGQERRDWLERLDRERNNLNAALRWSGSALEGVTTMARLAAALTPYWRLRGALSAGRRWLDVALPRTVTGDATRARALLGAGLLAGDQGDTAAARSLLDDSMALWRALDDRRGQARTLVVLGALLVRDGDAAATPPLEEGLRLARELGDPTLAAGAAYQLGMRALQQGDTAAARPRFEESLAEYRAAGELWDVALPLNALGVLALIEGEFAIARRHLDDALVLLDTAGDTAARVAILGHLTRVHWAEGDMLHVLERGRVWLERAREAGDREAEARALLILGIAARSRHDDERAFALLTESLALSRELGNVTGIAGCLAGFARIARADGQTDLAARLFSAAQGLVERAHPVALADRLDLARITAAIRAGASDGAPAVSPDQAMALIAALSVEKE